MDETPTMDSGATIPCPPAVANIWSWQRWTITSIVFLVSVAVVGMICVMEAAQAAFRIPAFDEWHPEDVSQAERDPAGRLAHFRRVLSRASTPAHLYFGSVLPDIVSSDGPLTWESEYPVLRDSAGHCHLMIDSRAEIYRVSDREILAWNILQSGIEIRLITIDQLRPISSPSSYPERTDWITTDPPPNVRISIPLTLPTGVHRLPDLPSILGEPIPLWVSHWNLVGTNFCREHARLVVLDGARGMVDVIDPIWWNDGELASEYHWIGRVAWDPVSAKIIGDGTRIRPFVLNAAQSAVEAWLW